MPLPFTLLPLLFVANLGSLVLSVPVKSSEKILTEKKLINSLNSYSKSLSMTRLEWTMTFYILERGGPF